MAVPIKYGFAYTTSGVFSLPKGYKGKKAHNSIFLVYSPLYCYTNSTDLILCVNNTTCTCTDVFTITTKDQSGGRKLYIAETRLSHVRGHSHNDNKECVCMYNSLVPRPSITANAVEGLVKLLCRMTSVGR